MITIYSAERTISQPYNIPTQDIEDCRDRQFVINLMRWFAFEIIGLIKGLIQLTVFYLLMGWPVILYG